MAAPTTAAPPPAGPTSAAAVRPTVAPAEDFGAQRLAPGAGATATAVRSQLIRIAGRFVQLPPDAYVERELNVTTCARGATCPEVPTYELVRGNSTATVGGVTGTIFGETVAPGEEGAFDFLRR